MLRGIPEKSGKQPDSTCYKLLIQNAEGFSAEKNKKTCCNFED